MKPAVPNFPVGLGPPNVWPITFLAGDSGVDLTTVTAVLIDVEREVDGSTDTWTATIQGGTTPDELLAHVEFSGAEITTLGLYRVAPSLVVSSGVIPCSSLEVFAVSPRRLRL